MGYFLSVPAQTINAAGPPGKTNSPLYGKRNKNIGAIIAGVIGGVAVVVALITISSFVRRRRRRARPRSILSFSTDFREAGPELIVTPFDPYSFEAEHEPLVTGEPDAEMVALHRLSSTPPTPLQPETPVPVGLSDKKIARLRAEGFNSPGWQSRNLGVSSSDVIRSTSSPNAVPEPREAPYDPRRLHSEVESLVRREMERLHAEGLVNGAPPSYTEGEG